MKETSNIVSSNKRERGKQAEDLAVCFLETQGYHVIQRQYRIPQGEIDIIAWEDKILCFIEVRSRQDDKQYDPLETITYPKTRRVIAAAQHYIDQLERPWPEMRFDAVGIVFQPKIKYRLVRAAFEV